jgi:hypothetical protein
MASFVQRWKGSRGVLGLMAVLGSFGTKLVWPDSPVCVRLSPTELIWPVSETGLTGFRFQQLCRVCFRCVCCVVSGWVLLLGPVAL